MVLLLAPLVRAQSTPPETPAAVFRRANENAARSQWDEALAAYAQLEKTGSRAPSLYWNWAQTAAAGGRKGEALWALIRARDLHPADSSLNREIDGLRGELGLDPSETSLGLLGDLRVSARRFRLDIVAAVMFFVSIGALIGRKPRPGISRAAFAAGALFALPFLLGVWRETRGVIIQKDAPLLDIPRNDAIALANLREGEAVPLLGDEGDYLKIQDASGARGFAHKSDVRKIGME
jgi:hypothetical protein